MERDFPRLTPLQPCQVDQMNVLMQVFPTSSQHTPHIGYQMLQVVGAVASKQYLCKVCVELLNCG